MKSSVKAASLGGAALGVGLLVYFMFFHKGKHAEAVAASSGDANTAAALNQLSSQMSQLQQQASQPSPQPIYLPQATNPYMPGYNPAIAALQPALATSAPNTMAPPAQQPQSGYQWILGAGPTGPLWQQEPAPTPPGQHWAQSGTAFYLAANQPGISYTDYRPASPSLIVSATHA